MRALIFLCLISAASAQLLAKYYSDFDYLAKKCVGPYDWKWDTKIDFAEDQWKHGPRGQVNKFCVTWTGTINLGGKYLWAEADDGVIVDMGGSEPVIDVWNSFDPRPCHKASGGCRAPGGSRPITITYYQDRGSAHFHLKSSSTLTGKRSIVTGFGKPSGGSPNDPWATEIVDLSANKPCCYKSLDPTCKNDCKETALQPILYGRLGEVMDIYRSTYWKGKGSASSSFFYIEPCTKFLYLGKTNKNDTAETANNNLVPNDDNVILEVQIDDSIDYYKPLPGHNLCDMLMNNRHHLWSKTGEPFTFIQPAYINHNTLVGGSAANWPMNNIAGDKRVYLNLWGGNGRNGACCHQHKNGVMPNGKQEKSQWNKQATLRVRALLPGLVEPKLNTKLQKDAWEDFAWVSGKWDTTAKYERDGTTTGKFPTLAAKGLRDSYSGLNSGAYYLRKCEALEGDTKNSYLMMCLSSQRQFGVPKEGEYNKNGTKTTCDVFRPVRDTSVCEMMTTGRKHLWCAKLESINPIKCSHWVRPTPNTRAYLGGSANLFPAQYCERGCRVFTKEEDCNINDDCFWYKSPTTKKYTCGATDEARREKELDNQANLCDDKRAYVPFWGGYRGAYGRQEFGGAKSDWLDPGKEDWHRDSRLFIQGGAPSLGTQPKKPTLAPPKPPPKKK